MSSTHDPPALNIKDLFPAHSRKIDILEQRFSGTSTHSNDAESEKQLDEGDGEEVVFLDSENEAEQNGTPKKASTSPSDSIKARDKDKDRDGDGDMDSDRDVDKDRDRDRDADKDRDVDKDGERDGDRECDKDNRMGAIDRKASTGRDSSHKYGRFSQEEDRKIIEGYAKFGNKWEEIARWANLDRSSSQISSRFTRKLCKSSNSMTGSPALSGYAVPKDDPDKLGPSSVSLNRATEAEDQPPTKQRRIDADRRDSGNVKPEITTPTVVSPALHPPADGSGLVTSNSLSPARNGIASLVETNIGTGKLGSVGSETKTDDRISVAEQALKGREAQLVEWENKLKDWEWRLQQKANEEHKKSTELICDLLVGRARAERALARKKLAEDCVRFGQSSYERRGLEMVEMWQDGEVFRQLEEQLRSLAKFRETLETKKKQLAKTRQSAYKSNMADGVSEEEILKVRIMAIKREEAVLQEERDRLLAPKLLHMKELRRANDEDQSPLSDFRRLNDRYLLLSLLGKGGFSEVYLAFDLKEHRQVACKIHSVNTMWSVTKRQNYTKHAIREYKIHKELVHDKVVKLFDVFEIDSSSFCTVLEYCEGGDLDSYLKQNKMLSEREAKCIIAQIFSGLKYLSSQKRPIIHYDLKPGNIIFQTNGEVKITDFGLSKIMEEDSEFVELTSQGAGTYWYLPPECFEMGGKHPPMISSKVDVWSVGVIFYQLLYGKKPFGNEMSQQKFLSENVAAQTTRVEFPSKPVVSKEAKDFLQKCLTHNQMLRPDVQSCCSDPFLSQVRTGGKKTAPVTLASSNPQMPPPKGNTKRKIDSSE